MWVITPDICFTKLVRWFIPPPCREEGTWRTQWSIVTLPLYLQLCHCLLIGVFVCWGNIQIHKCLTLYQGQRACSYLWTGPVFCHSRECGHPVEMIYSAVGINVWPWWTTPVPAFSPLKDISLVPGKFPPSAVKTFFLGSFILIYVSQCFACLHVYMCITYMPRDSCEPPCGYCERKWHSVGGDQL